MNIRLLILFVISNIYCNKNKISFSKHYWVGDIYSNKIVSNPKTTKIAKLLATVKFTH